MARLLLMVCGFTMLLSAVFAAFWMVHPVPNVAFKLAGCAGVATLSLFTILVLGRPGQFPILSPVLLAGAAGLTALGVEAIRQQVDPRNPDPEGYLLVTGLAFVLQGALSWWVLPRRARVRG
jgi:hypothetical protein